MVFSDADLVRLKEKWEISRQSSDTWFGIDRYEAQALLARLGAAEAYIQTVAEDGPLGAFDTNAYETWRQRSGK